MLNVPDEVYVIFHHDNVMIRFLSRTFGHAELHVEISCSGSEWQLSSLTQVCALCVPLPLHGRDALHRTSSIYFPQTVGKMASKTLNGWIFLRPFNGVKSLYLPTIFTLGVGSSLKELIGDRITEVLPTLQNINIFAMRGYHWQKSQEFEGIKLFVDRRRLSGHPMTISLKNGPLELNWFNVERVRDHYSYFSVSP
ncbi:hypothetical protein F5888DRAFT_1710923 [Russula emetica]|nr:hypothetical protein F5888DRAFT_1710923 [Russula emetica]